MNIHFKVIILMVRFDIFSLLNMSEGISCLYRSFICQKRCQLSV